ncbi:MAG: phosphatase PAP2 family protein [Gemmatimonadaceae bacterium]|nr:phosphatase PAP2 family protein [Gemmatimonadaceae bacterium]
MPWLRGLDARDHALFARCALSPSCAVMSRRFWMSITHLGGARGSIACCLLALAIPGVTPLLVWHTLLLLGASHLVVQVVKRTVGRPRPTVRLSIDALIQVPDRFSFPSGHACAAMAVAVGFASAFPTLALPLLALAWTVGFSRVVLGVHYPGDVLVGQVIALACAWPLIA